MIRLFTHQSGVDEKAGMAGPDERGIAGTAGSENRDLDDSVLLEPCTTGYRHRHGQTAAAPVIALRRDEDH